METAYLYLVNILMVGGILLVGIFSNASVLIYLETDYKSKRWSGYGHSIEEIKKAIQSTDNYEVQDKLRWKITLRRIGYMAIFTGLLIIVIFNLFFRG